MTTSALRSISPFTVLARMPGWLTALTCSGLAALLGWLFLTRPSLALFAAVPFAALPLVLSARVRLLVFVFGSLVVFQSSDELTPQKVLFFAGVMVSVGAIVVRLPALVGTTAYHDLKPLLRASVVLLVVVGASFVVSYANDVPQKPWVRDAAPYVLVACAPLFALDAYRAFSRTELRRLIAIAGLLGAAAFTVVWLTRRSIADLGFIPFGLGTMLLPAAGFAYAMSVFLEGNRARYTWLAIGTAIPAMMLATGTRTALLLAAAPLAIAFGGRRHLMGRSLRLLVAVPLIALFGLAMAQGVLALAGGDRDVLAKRLDLVEQIGSAQDQSYSDRVSQTESAWTLFRSSPLVGVGPGAAIDWTDTFGRPHSSPNVDSPVSFLTKYGAMGFVALGFLVLGFTSVLSRLRARVGRRTIVHYALIGFGATFVAWSMLVNSLEDKGLAVGLALLLALAVREAADADSLDASSVNTTLTPRDVS